MTLSFQLNKFEEKKKKNKFKLATILLQIWQNRRLVCTPDKSSLILLQFRLG
jgi:hypothetical protein